MRGSLILISYRDMSMGREDRQALLQKYKMAKESYEWACRDLERRAEGDSLMAIRDAKRVAGKLYKSLCLARKKLDEASQGVFFQ